MAKLHRFQPGNPGGPGRHKGSRSIAIEIIYHVFDQYGKAGFRKEMIRLVKQNPVAFYLKFIEPIQPKELQLTGKDGGSIILSINKDDEAL